MFVMTVDVRRECRVGACSPQVTFRVAGDRQVGFAISCLPPAETEGSTPPAGLTFDSSPRSDVTTYIGNKMLNSFAGSITTIAIPTSA